MLRFMFFILIIRPIVFLIIGLNARHRNRLPVKGPAIIIANHNSHLDTAILISLLPISVLKRVRPVAAADYFLKNKWLKWFSTKIVGIIPIKRKISRRGENPLASIQEALDENSIVIYFPEGSRGEPEEMSQLKKGIARLAEENPTIPVYPIFMHGLGKSLPKDESLLVPFVVDVVVGEPVYWTGNRIEYMNLIKDNLDTLKSEIIISEWE